MTSSYTSNALIVADQISDYINGLSLGFTSTVSVSDVYVLSKTNALSVVVSPLTTVIGRDARDVLRERVATQIMFVKRVGRQTSDVDALIKIIEDLQTSLFFLEVSNGSKSWSVEQVEVNGNIQTAGGDDFDGIYNGEALGDAGVFKTGLIVASSRFLKVS